MSVAVAHPDARRGLLALLSGEIDACPCAASRSRAEEERVECPACGSVLEPAPREVIPGQMTLIDG